MALSDAVTFSFEYFCLFVLLDNANFNFWYSTSSLFYFCVLHRHICGPYLVRLDSYWVVCVFVYILVVCCLVLFWLLIAVVCCCDCLGSWNRLKISSIFY